MEKQNGQSLSELVIVLAVLGTVMGVGLPAVQSMQRAVALNSATSELRGTIMYVRAMAIARDRNIAIRFRAEERGWTWTAYEDGDGDGVRNDDISTGKDRRILPTARFLFGPAGIGLPEGKVPDPLAGGKPLALRAPVRFNSSMLCSFTRRGEVTNGSVVLSDGRNATIVRVHGTSGRVQVLRWNGTGWKSGV